MVFILEIDGTLFLIEVKASSHPSRSDARGILAFRQSYPQRKIGPGPIIAPTDSQYQVTENVRVIPWDLQQW